MKQQRPLREGCAPVVLVYLGIYVPVRFEQVEPSVVVVVEEPVAPTHKGNRRLRHPGLVAHIGKACIAVVVVQHLVVVAEVRHVEIDQSVVLVVACGNPHRRDLAAILVQRKSRHVALIVECSVTLIDVEEVGLRVVAHHEVWLAVVVDVHKDRGEAEVFVLVLDACFHRHIGKRTVSVRCGTDDRARPAVRVVRSSR